MKKFTLLISIIFLFTNFSLAQEFADFEITGTNEGTGSFTNAALPNFTWVATGTINGAVQILNDEVFDNGNQFETAFGQADNAENLRIQVYPNGAGTAGTPILSKAGLTISFNETTPKEGWGFCLVDIDVENCLISAIDENDNEIAVEDIDDWLIELFDTDTITDGTNIPRWDPIHAALLGNNTPEEYTVYNNQVIGGLNDSEAAAAYFMPDIPLKSLTIVYENLQDSYYTSYHFYIASLMATGIHTNDQAQLNIYPNPVSDILYFEQLPKTTAFDLKIIDIHGRVVHSQKSFSGKNIDVSELQAGIYYLTLQSKNEMYNTRFIKK